MCCVEEYKKMRNFKEFLTKKTLVGLGLGQFLSLLITSTGFTSSELAKRGIDVFVHVCMLYFYLIAVDHCTYNA